MPAPSVGTVLDNFDRANTGPPPSTNWTNGIVTFVAGEGLIVQSNRCTDTAAGGFRQGSYWNAATIGPNLEVIVTITTWTASVDNELDLYGRLVNVGAGTTDGYGLSVNEDGGADPIWAFARTDNGVGNGLGVGVRQDVQVGSQIAFQMIGSNLYGWYKAPGGSWTQVVTASDSTYTAAGFVGVELAGANQEIVFDTFIAGNPDDTQTRRYRTRRSRMTSW